MRLGLSSAAAPDAGLAGLLEAARRRGLDALELREGDRHGVATEGGALTAREAAERTAAAGIAITGFQVAEPGDDRLLARLADRLGCPIVLDGPDELGTRIDRARRILVLGGRALVVVRGPAAERQAAIARAAGTALAWDVEPGSGDLGGAAASLLARFGDRLHRIRLLGGGPETAVQGGVGIGALIGSLARAPFRGTLVIAPSASRYLVAWSTWLRQGGWGCGGGEGAPVRLARPAKTGGLA